MTRLCLADRRIVLGVRKAMCEDSSAKGLSALRAKLAIDCAACSGLCCVALYCAKTDGFPEDKVAGLPCKNLLPDFCCAIHSQLAPRKMRGCMAYECFGAGQLVTQLYGPDTNWQTQPNRADEMFHVFSIVFQLRQLLWYLIEARSAASGRQVIADAEALILEHERLTSQPPAQLRAPDVEAYRYRVNTLLKKVVASITTRPFGERRDYLGKHFRGANLDGADFSMSLMIAANLEGCSLRGTCFLGADMRDASIKNTDVSQCVFLTQMQVNAARGNAHTVLPPGLTRPTAW